MRDMPALLRLGLLAALAACSGNPSPSATTPQPAPAPRAASAAPPAAQPAAAPPAVSPPVALASTPAPTPASAAIPASGIDLAGVWIGTVDVQGQTIAIDVTLTRGASGAYTGEAAPEGQPSAQMTSLRLDGNHLVMVFSAPDGEATFDMTVTADRQAFTGNIAYQGQQLPFTARRRH